MNRLKLSQGPWTVPLSALLSVFLESACPLCDRTSATLICARCCKQLDQSRLAVPLHPGKANLPVLAWGAYQGSLRQAIASLKYHQKPALAEWLGASLGEVWMQQRASLEMPRDVRPLVVPIPLHPDKQRQRGFNQAELIAHHFCQATGLPLATNGLIRVRTTQAQHGLGALAREKNLANAFALSSAWQSKPPTQPIFLVDDIYTTGATVLSATETLKRYGISVIGVGTIARAIPSAALEQFCKKVSKA